MSETTTKKQKVLDVVPIDMSFLYTSLDKAAKLLLMKKDELEIQGWSSLHLKLQGSYESLEVVMKGMRPETAEETERRVATEDRERKKRERTDQRKKDKEFEEYQRLKKKFENHG